MQQTVAGLNFFNSKEVEWSDQSFYLNGVLCKIRDIKWGVKTAKTHLHSSGDDPDSIQSGNREPTGSMTMLKNEFDAFTAACIAAGGRDVTDVSVDVQVSYKAKGKRALQTVVVQSLEISEYMEGMSQGADHMEIVMPFLFLSTKII